MSNYHTILNSDPISEDVTDPRQTPNQPLNLSDPGPRASYALDPIARIRLSNLAKWGLLAALLLFVLWLPAHFYAANRVEMSEQSIRTTTGGHKLVDANGNWVSGDKGKGQRDASGHLIQDETPVQSTYSLMIVFAVILFGVIIATGLPRIFLSNIFGRSTEAVNAARDWVVVGVITAILYTCGALLLKALSGSVGWISANADSYDTWYPTRGPLVLVSAMIGLLVARSLALRADGMVGQGALNALGQLFVQAFLVVLLFIPFEKGIYGLTKTDGAAPFLLIAAILMLGATLAILIWAWNADRKLIALQGKDGSFRATDDPIEITLTVIGGRESGKTVLLAAAYYEWSLRDLGPLQVRPASDAFGNGVAGHGYGAGGDGPLLELRVPARHRRLPQPALRAVPRRR